MTHKEAVKQLEFMAINLQGELAKGNELAVKKIEAIDMAQAALGKQIEKEPIMKKSAGSRCERFYCPNCAETVSYDDWESRGIGYCLACGQALKWRWRPWQK